MAEPNTVSVPIRFGPFEVSVDSGELRKNGTRLKLSGQAIQVLIALLQKPGQLISREELQEKLWPGASFGDFEHGLNAVIKRLRDVLGDSAIQPKFIETVPRRGYRFVGSLNDGGSARSSAIQSPEVEPSLLSRFFSLFGTTPYRRWEVMHLRMIVWCLLLAYLGWRFLACATHKWRSVLFLGELSCIVFLLISLSFLLYTGSSSPSSLPCEIRKLAPWVRWTTVTLVLVTWAMAVTVFTSHTILATVLVLCGTAGGTKYLLFKSAFDRDVSAEPR